MTGWTPLSLWIRTLLPPQSYQVKSSTGESQFLLNNTSVKLFYCPQIFKTFNSDLQVSQDENHSLRQPALGCSFNFYAKTFFPSFRKEKQNKNGQFCLKWQNLGFWKVFCTTHMFLQCVDLKLSCLRHLDWSLD